MAMKPITTLLLTSFIMFGCGEKKSESPYKEGKYSYFYEMIPVDEVYRQVIGYDSIQIMGKFMDEDKLEVNFCYPNVWQRVKWKNYSDTSYLVDYYDSKTGKIKWREVLLNSSVKDTPYKVLAVNKEGDTITITGVGDFIPQLPDTSYKEIKVFK